MRISKFVLAGLLTVGAVHAPTPVEARQVAQAGDSLHRLLASEWDYAMAQDPLWASYVGDSRFNDRWKDLSAEAHAGRAKHYEETLKRLARMDRAKLSSADQLNYDLFKREIAMLAEEASLGTDRMPLSHKEGIHIAHDIVDALRFETVKDYEDWIGRMKAFPRYMDQTLDLMREGKAAGLIPPKAILSRIPGQLKLQMPAKAEDSPFYKPFEKMASGVPAAEQERLRSEARAAIQGSLIPAYRKFDDYFTREYLPASPEKVGLRNCPTARRFTPSTRGTTPPPTCRPRGFTASASTRCRASVARWKA